MKKLLLLFIPLVFFFSCENEEEENVDCSCGEVIDIDVYDAFDGYMVPVIDPDTGQPEVDYYGNPVFITEGAHDGYSIPIVQMNCSEEIITLCNNLEVGDSFCFDYVGDCYFASCEWMVEVPVVSVNNGIVGVELQDMLIQSITVNGGSQLEQGPNGEIVSYDCN